MKGWFARRTLLGAMAVAAAVAAGLTGAAGSAKATTTTATTAGAGSPPVSPHVVIVGISGLRWTDVSAAATPALWNVARKGSVGSLVDYAVIPHTCPADGWLTLNAGAPAQVPHAEKAPCPALPAVISQPGKPGLPGSARVPAMPSLVSRNGRFHNSPQWGLLASAAGTGNCATAVGPGAALALASPGGHVGSYLPAGSAISRQLLARCPLTVVDLGSVPAATGAQATAARAASLRHADAELAAITADLPPGTTLMVTAPGASGMPPHLQVIVVSGPAYRSGVLDAASTRQPGMAVLTDLTPTVLHWRGQAIPAGVAGSQLTRAGRGSLTSAVRGLADQDTATQVWTGTHTIFFWAYVLADVAAFGGIGLIYWGGQAERRRRRAASWRVAGTFAGAVPAGSFLASLVPWWQFPHPVIWLYGLTVAWTAVLGAVALAGPWRRDPFGPPGAVAAVTVAVIGLDVMTGSRLQLNTPFGLSVLVAGRYYGIGGEAVGIYAVCGMVAAAWAGNAMLRRGRASGQSQPGPASSRDPARHRSHALLAASAVAAFAVIACGWPQFGAKVGGTIAMVPGFVLLLMAMAGLPISVRRVALVLGSGLALFTVFAFTNYLVPATGQSDIGAFAGNLLHGHAGELLQRKVTSMIGSLGVNAYSPLVPAIVVVVGLMLAKPSWFALKALPRGYSAESLLGMTLAMMWLVAVLGCFADDSGIVVPAAALPLALPLGIALLAGVPPLGDTVRGHGQASGGALSRRPDRIAR
ncbi:MAG TPA: hypothetical protein VE733_07975 [Streptosporangiaceae bacterium]|nr:hypothetical protein [Streptosporangiaceae bacterium]